ncbi:MAG: NUDIX domain-containing protein [Patescibacteria group bacterium]
MEIEEDIAYDGKNYHIVYSDADSFYDLPKELVRQHYGVCFYKGKIVVGWHEQKKVWGLLGGKIESGESFDEALVREVQEESNMRILEHRPIGYQKSIQADGGVMYQLRSLCLVEPIGDFVSDPSGSVTKIKLINVSEWDEHIDWGEVGRRILERSLELKSRVDSPGEGI